MRWRATAAAFIAAVAITSPAFAEFAMAVADFDTNGVPFHLGAAVSDIVRNELSTLPEITMVVVDRNHIVKAAGEQKIGMSGLVAPETAAKVGRIVGARYVLVGSVNSLGGEISLDSRLVDVESGEVIESFSASSDAGQEGLPEAASYLAEDIKIVLTGS
ncbi:hypothetical protein Dpep_1148 [Dethiosulfovibrio peptidovorans DSM 11002]|uniref:Curli production assembly/transport component CsgG n=1 Tax=Dethiosulfovibrio peptidovorans DSM 11002 TaxID=469381 RepID=D2Z6S7_9BACT|nr:CsgG/HfaB family protein [Dethiosulfovibrio peptidovorans]EFC91174.1 hypothetical protein Dpep_1148 [Dethiosulfovibrio peptidovorans DSM 11002]